MSLNYFELGMYMLIKVIMIIIIFYSKFFFQRQEKW